MLFNRGECYRRTGDAENAIDDYREFLEKVPNAPNRADIEAKIVALEAPGAVAAVAKPARRAGATPPPSRAARSPPRAAAAEGGRDAAPSPPPPAPRAAPMPETKPEPAVAVRSAPRRRRGRRRPAAAAGPGSGSRCRCWPSARPSAGYFVFRPHDQPPPDTALGNYRF